MQCAALIEGGPWQDGPIRRCGRDTVNMVGPLPVCWQHEERVADHFRRSLRVGELEAEVNQLRSRVDELEQDAWTVVVTKRRSDADSRTARSVVYFAQMPHTAATHPCHGLVKIGRTSDLARRMESLGAEALVTIPGGAAQEAELHRHFAALRVHGEWFQCDGELAAFLAQARAA